MRRIVAFSLCLAMLLSLLCACGSSDSAVKELMPYDLEFGMTYEEVIALDPTAAAGELEPADANDGYVSGLHLAEEKDESDVISVYFGVENDEYGLFRWIPRYGYSFNQNKVLYEYNILFSFADEGDAEYVYNLFVDYYSQRVDVEPVENESNTAVSTVFDGEELRVSVSLTEEDGELFFILGLHDYTHDLNSVK